MLVLCGHPEQKYAVRTAASATVMLSAIFLRTGTRRSAEMLVSRTRRNGSTNDSTPRAPKSGTNVEPVESRFPITSGRSEVAYSASRTRVSTKARFSSTMNTVLTPRAVRRMVAVSNGCKARSFRTRMPRSAAASGLMPRTPSAAMTSSAV